MPHPDHEPPRRRLIIWLVLPVLLALVGWQAIQLFSKDNLWPPDDYVEYWAAGRLNASGQNPYDPDLLLPLERDAGRDTDEAVMMWNPPWTLALVMPVGLLPARVGQVLWLLANIGMILCCADWTWRIYGGQAEKRWVSWILAVTFMPTLFVLGAGQISVYLLLGATGFLYFMEKEAYAKAGLMAALLGIKPHLFYLFWLALLFWSIRKRQWSVIVAGLAAGTLATLVVVVCNPAVWQQYWHALTQHPPEQWVSLTLGSLLRILFGPQHFWLQFIPPLLGICWLVPYWYRRRAEWDWGEEFPQVILISFLTSAYGAWHFDMVVLLLPVVCLAVRLLQHGKRNVIHAGVVIYAVINGVALAISITDLTTIWYAWITPALLASWWGLRRMQSAREYIS